MPITDEELLATEWIVEGSLQRNGVTYADGTHLVLDDAQAIRALRVYGALKTASERLPSATIEAERVALAAENQSLRERLAALEVAQAQTSKGK